MTISLTDPFMANITPWDSGCPFHLGGIYDPSGDCAYTGQFFNGLIDEATVYSEALPADAVAALYKAGEFGKCGSLGYWLEYYFGMNCWSEWYGAGTADADGDFVNNFGEYLGHTDPNKIRFSIPLTSLYVTNTALPLHLNVAGGIPSFIAWLTNAASNTNASWQPYFGTDLNLTLGPADGFYEVWVGLKGLPADAQQTWVWNRFKLDRTPPHLVITGPASATVQFPLLQLTGYSEEALSSLTYSISNAAGSVTGQQAVITGQSYSTNTAEFTTNYFQCYDVPLTTGLNVITLQAADLAGNMATLTTNIVCAGPISPPGVALVWPQDGMEVSADSITIQGQVDDPTATVSVAVTDGGGSTNCVGGLVGRDGVFWLQNVPLNTTTTYLAVTLSNAVGGTTTNFMLTKSDISISVSPVQAGDTRVSGTIGTNGYTIWVNGVQATQDGGDWTAQIAPVGLHGGLVSVTAIPSSGPCVNAQTTVEVPQGVFISQYRRNQQMDTLIPWLGGWAWQHSSDVMNWEDGPGGSQAVSDYVDKLFQEPRLVETDWPATAWPQPLTNGAETTIIWNNFSTPPTVTSNTFLANGPALPQMHCDINETPCGGPNVRRTADTELMLATGGPLGSRQMNLWCLSANAIDLDTGLPIPPEEIEIGGFGYQDANAELWVMLPDNDPDEVTPRPTKPTNWKKNYSFGINGKEYQPRIFANGQPLSDTYVWRDFCVGEGIYFDVLGLPDRMYEAVAVWSLPGTFVNRQPDQKCLAYYDEDATLLTRSSVTNGGLMTYAWYVEDLQPATVSVEVRFRRSKSLPWHTNTFSGKFNVHRPTATFMPPPSLDGTPTPMVTNGWLTLGWNRSQDMSFGYQVNPGGFAGQAGFTQLASGEYTSSATGQPLAISTNGLALDNGEFFRGIVSLPAGTSTPVPVWDGPRDALYPQTGGAKMDVDYYTYLLFQPDIRPCDPGPNIFVPLCLVSWELHDEAANSIIVNPSQGGPQVVGPGPSDSTAFPRWISVWTNP